ncbi:MAG: zinc-ribbon domain-containing protein [Oscillospiraceae bacterium]|nr:zinc-ribbon domain-containing protein [Oscillospiraceae bacterium]
MICLQKLYAQNRFSSNMQKDAAVCLAKSFMPHIARDWHSTKNRRLRPDEVYKESTKKVWWKCSQCGYEWFGSVRGRTVNGIGCKKCHRNNPFIL